MIPNNELLNTKITTVETPTNTHKILYEDDRVNGYTDQIEAMKQAIYLILNTERYEFPIYPRSYGIELQDLFGKHPTYVMSMLRQRITEALLEDERIKTVSDFEFENHGRGKISVKFVVTTIFGQVDSGLEVTI